MKPASAIRLLSVVGLALSFYTIHVEFKLTADPTYVALCDGEWFSCTKIFSSEYGHMLRYWGVVPEGHPLDQSNAHLGVCFYSAMFVYPLLRWLPLRRPLYLAASAFSLVTAVWLGYVLLFVIKDICVVCISTYIVNTLIFAQLLRDSGSGSGAKRVRKKAE